MEMTETTTSIPSILTIMGILRDSLDDVCKTGERAFAIIEEHERKMEPFKDIKLDEGDVTKEILTALSPEKASALVVAITDATKLTQSFPLEDAEKQLANMKEGMANLQKIRDNLHKALDGVVP